MQTTDLYELQRKAEALGLGDNLRGSEIVFHLEAVKSLLAKEQKILKAATSTIDPTVESGVDITVRILQEKYGK
ncbi:hypothetical protein HX857_25215 [Pseudomonas gingeri]|uniref:hypothetical protein n=1 Tax=Pseudomonas gingeri TaxID=117681 RepID=UPI0015C10509|nr:hypothetical protein [Pseudomonas gingeri]NWE72010.1 hypothetical protein [Pseudomonas gingeri]